MIINDTCVNRVAKVFKVVLDGNDLAQLDAGPIDLFPIVEGDRVKFVFAVSLFNDRNNDYTGTLGLACNCSYTSFLNSWTHVSENSSLSLDILFDSNGFCQVVKRNDFSIGLVRGPIELHIYYFEEKVSVPFSYGYQFDS